jgi:hypothetical protein
MDTGQVGSRRHEERAQHGRLPIPQRSGRSAATIVFDRAQLSHDDSQDPSESPNSLRLPAQLLAPPSRQVTCRVILVPRSLGPSMGQAPGLHWHLKRAGLGGDNHDDIDVPRHEVGWTSVRSAATGRHLLSLFFLPTTLQMTATRLLERCASDLCLLRSSLTS